MYLNPTYCNCSIAEFVNWAMNYIHSLGVSCPGGRRDLRKINVTNCGKFRVVVVAVVYQFIPIFIFY